MQMVVNNQTIGKENFMKKTGANDTDVKNIVVFGANGGIGADVTQRLAQEIENGKPYHVTIVSRKGDKYDTAQILENLEATVEAEGKGDLLKNLEASNIKYDPKNLEALRPILENVDIGVCAAGLPRPDPAPLRKTLIYPNSKITEEVATAFGLYAPKNAPLLLGTNPLDNTVQIADDVLRKVWKENRQSKDGDLPQVKVFGMAGTLDETRLKIYSAKVLNQALEQKAKAEGKNKADVHVRAEDIKGDIYGQHGPSMVVDLDSVTVLGVKLQDFIKQNDITEQQVEITNAKGQKDTMSIANAINAETIDGGAKIIAGLGRSTQTGASKRIVDLVNDFFSLEKKKAQACVVSNFLDNADKVSYGRPIEIGDGSIEIADFPERNGKSVVNVGDATIEKTLTHRILESQKVTKKDQQHYIDCGNSERSLLDSLNGVDREKIKVTINSADLEKAKADKKNVFEVLVKMEFPDGANLNGVLGDIKTITDAVNDPKIDGNVVTFKVPSNVVDPTRTLAGVMGTKAEEHEIAEEHHQGFARKHGLKPKLPELSETENVSFAKRQGLPTNIERKNKPVIGDDGEPMVGWSR